MLKPDQSPDEEPKEPEDVPDDQGPSFEELIMLVFSGPMRFECVEETEDEAEGTAEEGEGGAGEKSN